MKKLLLTLCAAVIVQFAVAQYYCIPWTNAGMNPGGLNNDVEFPVGGGISPGWSTIMGGAPTSPTWSAAQAIPFPFKFNGSTVTAFKVSHSGVLTFTTAASAVPAYGTVSLPNASVPDNSVCILGLKPYGNNAAYANIVTKNFGTSGNMQCWITFSAYNDPALTITGFNFWAIVLEETTNNIYVVDQRSYGAAASKLSVGIQIDATTAVAVTGSPNLPALAGTNSTPSDNSYYQFMQGVQPTFDLIGVSKNVTDYLILGQAPFTIGANFRNLGTNKVTSADLNYQVNGGATVTAAATAAVNPLSTAIISSPTKWTPSATGIYSIKVWASNLNGNPDANPANDAVTFNVTVVDNFTPKIVLYEGFSSSTCGPCNPGNVNFNSVVSTKDPNSYVTIKYQMNYPGTGDPYYTTEAGTRHSYYGINSIPRLEVAGHWDGNSNSFTSALHDAEAAKPSFFELSGTNTIHYKSVAITANIKPLTDVTSTTLYLFAAVTEKRTEKNIKTNGETEFFHVMKKMVPSPSGTLLSGMTKNTTKTVNLNYTFPGVYTLAPSGAQPINITTQNSVEDYGNLEVVMWIQDISNKDVLQAAHATGTYQGIDNQHTSVQNIGIVPNPTNGVTKVDFLLGNDNKIDITVVDALGKVVKTFPTEEFTTGLNSFDFNASNLSSGVYFIRFNGESFSTTQKFVVR